MKTFFIKIVAEEADDAVEMLESVICQQLTAGYTEGSRRGEDTSYTFTVVED